MLANSTRCCADEAFPNFLVVWVLRFNDDRRDGIISGKGTDSEITDRYEDVLQTRNNSIVNKVFEEAK